MAILPLRQWVNSSSFYSFITSVKTAAYVQGHDLDKPLLHNWDEEDKVQLQHNDAFSRQQVSFSILCFFAGAIFTATTVWLYGLVQHSYFAYIPVYDSNYSVSYKTNPCDCGSSIKEALSRGCIYDQLSAGWLPRQCRDDELTAEFGRRGDGPNGDWQYWADYNHTQLLTLEEVSLYADRKDDRFHMSYEWHVEHCFFLWRKEHRMKTRPGKYYEPKNDKEHHIEHCIEVLTGRPRLTNAGAFLVG